MRRGGSAGSSQASDQVGGGDLYREWPGGPVGAITGDVGGLGVVVFVQVEGDQRRAVRIGRHDLVRRDPESLVGCLLPVLVDERSARRTDLDSQNRRADALCLVDLV